MSEEAATIGFRPPKEAGLWLLDTGNPNCWETARTRFLNRTSADVTMLQEMRKPEKELAAAQASAGRANWRAHFTPSLTTSKGGASGGTAATARKGIGLIPHEGIVKDGFSHRIGAAWVGGVLNGGVHVISVYLKDGDNMGQTNQAILVEAAALIGTLRGPWVIAGDWNISPDQLRQSNWVATVNGVIHEPKEPTCHSSTYDFSS